MVGSGSKKKSRAGSKKKATAPVEEPEVVVEPVVEEKPPEPAPPPKKGFFSKIFGRGSQPAPVTVEAPAEEPAPVEAAAVEAPLPESEQSDDDSEPLTVEEDVVSSSGRGDVQSVTISKTSGSKDQHKAKAESVVPPMPVAQIEPSRGFIKQYQIYPDNTEVFVGIERDAETGGYRYVVVEPNLSPVERQAYHALTKLLVDELEVDMTQLQNNKQTQVYLLNQVKEVVKKYNLKIPPQSYKKIAYYFNRDYLKMGKIDVFMNDPNIEDVSCDGPKIPIFIWHREFESIPTSVTFSSNEELNTFQSKLAYMSGKHVSIANPIVDATLPDGSRLQVTYGTEVSKRGGNFTIRKFKADPVTIVDLLHYNTLSPDLAAYLWYLVEKRMSLVVAGGTASGKTTTLNALSMFIPPDQKIVSVEDTPELNLSHKNWIQSVSRGGGIAGEITLFDLLKAALRQRPDIIIVGEIRGAEAFTLFQAIATGHGGLGTIHADSVQAGINRMTTEPMNVPKSLLGSTLDLLVMQLRIKLKDKSVRRMVHVAEIVGHESSTDQIVLNNAFKWDPVSDTFVFSGRSRLFEKVTKRFGTTPEQIRQDIEDRKIYLTWMMQKNIRDYKDLSQKIREFYASPAEMVEKAMQETGGVS